MITALHVGNFKAFGDTQRIPLRPLTLIYGANSAGKSSIIQSLVLGRHAIESGDRERCDLDMHRTTVGGEAIDLGGFRQYVHRRDAGSRVEWAVDLRVSGLRGRLPELFASVDTLTVRVEIGLEHVERKRQRPGVDPRTGKSIMIEEPTGELVTSGEPAVQTFTLDGDGRQLLQMSRRRDGKLQLDRLDHEHPVFREAIKAMVMMSTTTDDLRPEDYEGLEQAVADLVPEVVASGARFLPEGLAKTDLFGPGTQTTLFTISKGRRREDLAAAVRSFLPRKIDEILKCVSEAVAEEMGRLQYLGPLRSYPPRHLAFSQHHDPNWFAGGGYAWDVVRRDARVRGLVNEWLGSSERLQTPYRLDVQHLFTMSQLEPIIREINERAVKFGVQDLLNAGITDLETLLDQGASESRDEPFEIFEFEQALLNHVDTEEMLNQWQIPLLRDALRAIETDSPAELVLVDKRSNTVVSHRDVGIGISQVLPVLVSAHGAQGRMIAIEQPEIHLHPKLQAELGDVFISAALGERGNTFVLETHSEHLLLRVMKRMRQTADGSLPEGVPAVRPEDVMVLYVEPDGKRSIVREMPLNECGELVKAWPGGFFEEGLREVF